MSAAMQQTVQAILDALNGVLVILSPLPAPTVLHPALYPNAVEIIWDEVAGAIKYNIYRSTSSPFTPTDPPYAVVPAGQTSTVNSFVDSRISTQNDYFYVIIPVDANGNKGQPSPIINAFQGTQSQLVGNVVQGPVTIQGNLAVIGNVSASNFPSAGSGGGGSSGGGGGGTSGGGSSVFILEPVPFAPTLALGPIGANTFFSITLTGNVTSSTLVVSAPILLAFQIIQDSSGGHSFVWPVNVIGASAPSLAPGSTTLQLFIFDGTNAYPIGPATLS